jgi:hypothetical protein
MLHACNQRFDVTGNLENFCELNKSHQIFELYAERSSSCSLPFKQNQAGPLPPPTKQFPCLCYLGHTEAGPTASLTEQVNPDPTRRSPSPRQETLRRYTSPTSPPSYPSLCLPSPECPTHLSRLLVPVRLISPPPSQIPTRPVPFREERSFRSRRARADCRVP